MAANWIDARLAVLYAGAIANGAPADDDTLALIGRARAAARIFVDDRRHGAAAKGRDVGDGLALEAAFLAGYLVSHMAERDRDGPSHADLKG